MRIGEQCVPVLLPGFMGVYSKAMNLYDHFLGQVNGYCAQLRFFMPGAFSAEKFVTGRRGSQRAADVSGRALWFESCFPAVRILLSLLFSCFSVVFVVRCPLNPLKVKL